MPRTRTDLHQTPPPLHQTPEGQGSTGKPLLFKLHTRGPHVSGSKSGRKACRETEKPDSPQPSGNLKKKKKRKEKKDGGKQPGRRKQLSSGTRPEEEEGNTVIGKADKLSGW